MKGSSLKTTEEPAIIQCDKCGHRATTRARGFPALAASDLDGKVLVCTRCGHRQCFMDPVTSEARQAALAKALREQPSPSERVH
jgi:DNA-directed RNA polymerase subunit RPC12/RpoP